MSDYLRDGTGKGFLCKVDSTNKLEVHSVVQSEREEAVAEGKGFEIGAFPITFSGTTETAMIFIKNNGAPLVLDVWEFSGAESTGGTSDVCFLTLYQGVTSVTNGTAGTPVNSLFGSNRQLSVDVEIGNGSTTAIVGGTPFGASYIRYCGQSNFIGPWVISTGQTIALTVTPPASNTSMPLGVRIRCHLKREN